MQEKIDDFLTFLETEKGYADNTIAAYRNDLTQFSRNMEERLADPGQATWVEVGKDSIV